MSSESSGTIVDKAMERAWNSRLFGGPSGVPQESLYGPGKPPVTWGRRASSLEGSPTRDPSAGRRATSLSLLMSSAESGVSVRDIANDGYFNRKKGAWLVNKSSELPSAFKGNDLTDAVREQAVNKFARVSGSRGGVQQGCEIVRSSLSISGFKGRAEIEIIYDLHLRNPSTGINHDAEARVPLGQVEIPGYIQWVDDPVVRFTKDGKDWFDFSHTWGTVDGTLSKGDKFAIQNELAKLVRHRISL